jgi:hypothetical protein
MTARLGLTDKPRFNTSFVPLAVLGHCLMKDDFFAPVRRGVQVPIRTHHHTPFDKLLDCLISIWSGCTSIHQINVRLRPDSILAQAWQREHFAEQSTIADTLDAFTAESVQQLRQVNTLLLNQHSRTLRHDFTQADLWVDVDLSHLPASRRAEGSTKGFVSGEKNARGRQLVRVSTPGYHETLLSLVMPGNTHSCTAFKPAILELERLMTHLPAQRQHVVLRSDGGFGTDSNINWQLWRGYQILTKGYSGKRAKAQGCSICEWQTVRKSVWVGEAVKPIRYARRTCSLIRRWTDEKGRFQYATLIHSLLSLTPLEAVRAYDGRGAMEGEIKADKSGLHLERRRKRRLHAQEALVLLTDLAHNTLSWLQPWMFAGSPFANWGPIRIIRDLFAIPGEVVIKGGQLIKVRLSRAHPYASEMAVCLAKMLEKFDPPVS